MRVLELAGWRPVSYAPQLLTDDGADTIKIEPPGGDPMRTWPALFDRLNAGKRSACLDLKDPVGAGNRVVWCSLPGFRALGS